MSKILFFLFCFFNDSDFFVHSCERMFGIFIKQIKLVSMSSTVFTLREVDLSQRPLTSLDKGTFNYNLRTQGGGSFWLLYEKCKKVASYFYVILHFYTLFEGLKITA